MKKTVKRLVFSLAVILAISYVIGACSASDYKYRIEGKVNFPQGTDSLHNAVWYTDTFWVDGTSLVYTNSDSSVVRILPPYKVFELK
jgi:hypothetical protein